MFEYVDASGQIYTEDQINKMAAEQKTSANAIKSTLKRRTAGGGATVKNNTTYTRQTPKPKSKAVSKKNDSTGFDLLEVDKTKDKIFTAPTVKDKSYKPGYNPTKTFIGNKEDELEHQKKAAVDEDKEFDKIISSWDYAKSAPKQDTEEDFLFTKEYKAKKKLSEAESKALKVKEDEKSIRSLLDAEIRSDETLTNLKSKMDMSNALSDEEAYNLDEEVSVLTIGDLQEERKKAERELARKGESITATSLLNEAKNIYKTEKQKSIIYSKQFDFQEDLEGYDDDYKSVLKKYKLSEDKEADAVKAKSIVKSDYAKQLLESDVEKFTSLQSALLPDDHVYTSQEEVDQQNARIKELNNAKKRIDASLYAIETANKEAIENMNTSTTLKDEIKLFDKEWGWLNRTGLRTWKAFSDLGGGLFGTTGMVLDPIVEMATGNKDYFGKDNAKVSSDVDAFFNSKLPEARDVTDVESFGEYVGNEVIPQIPNTILAVAGGPTAVATTIGISTSGQKYNQMTRENMQGYYDSNGNLKMPEYNAAQLITGSLASGLFEGGSEYVFGRVAGRAKNIILNKASKAELEIFKKGLDKTLTQRAVAIVSNSAENMSEEIPAELINNILQNYTDKYIFDKDVDPLANSLDVLKSTATISTVFGAAPQIAVHTFQSIMPDNSIRDMYNISDEIHSIMKNVDYEALPDIEKKAIDVRVDNLNKKYSDIINKTASFANSNVITEGDNLVKVHKHFVEMTELRKQAISVKNSTLLDPVEKKKTLEALNEKFMAEKNSRKLLLDFAAKTDEVYRKAVGIGIANKIISIPGKIKSKKDIENGNYQLSELAKLSIEGNFDNITYIDTNKAINLYENSESTAKEVEKIDNLIANAISDGKLTKEEAPIAKRSLIAQKVNSLGQFGFLEVDGKKFVNKDSALMQPYGNIGVKDGNVTITKRKDAQKYTSGKHEVFHGVLKAIEGNMGKLGTELTEYVKNAVGNDTFNNSEFGKRISQYKEAADNNIKNVEVGFTRMQEKIRSAFAAGNIDQKTAKAYLMKAAANRTRDIKRETNVANEEALTILTESLSSGDIKLPKAGNLKFDADGNVVFDTAEDVYNFVAAYSESYSKKELAPSTAAVATGKVKGELISTTDKEKTAVDKKSMKSKETIDLEKRLTDLDEKFENEELEYDDYVARAQDLEDRIAKSIKNDESKPATETAKKKEVVVDDEADIKDIIREERGSMSSDKVQKIYEERGVDGAFDIIKLFSPITKKIVDKRRDAPGFDRELLTDEIETGVGGILDLITKYDPTSGTPLAAYINKYLPVRAITASRRVLDKDFSKDASEEKGLMATETADSGFTEAAKEKPKYKNILESNIFSSEELKIAENKILTVVRTLKNRIDAPISINRTVTPVIAEIRDAMGKQLDIDLKTMMGGKKDGVLRKWLLDNKRYVLENMTTTWLMGADGKGGIPQAIQKRIDGRWVNYPDWVGQKIDRESVSTDLAGRTSGAELARRLPNVFNNVSTEDYLGQILEPDGNPIRGRKESLAKAVAEEASFDIIMKDFANDGPIFEAFTSNQERQGVQLGDSIVQEFNKQADRGNVKYSMAIKLGLQISETRLANAIFNAKTANEETRVINNWIANDGRSIRTLAYRIFGKGSSLTTNRGIFEKILLPIIRANSKYNGVFNGKEYKLSNVFGGESIFLGDEKVKGWADTETIKKNWEASVNIIDEEAKAGTDELINVIKELKQSGLTELEARAYFSILKFDQRGLARKVSKAGLGVLGLTSDQKPYLEHNPPNYNIIEQAVNYFNGSISETDLRSFIDNSMINLVPAEINNFLPAYKEGQNRMHDPKVVLYLQGLIDKGHKILNIESEYGSRKEFNALVKLAKSGVNSKANLQDIKISNAIIKKNSLKPPKGISVFDFDDTVGLTKGNVLYTMPDGSRGKLNAEEFAKDGSRLLEEGAEFDFSEFSKVVDGKPGPMVEKMKKMIGKFGPENFFILTARPPAAAVPIHEFLSSIDIDIPLENITGLGNSKAQAKADWMVDKANEGYNDFYFSDDAIQNVEAVKNALDVLDVKSKIQQAKIKFSRTMSETFNQIIEDNKGVEHYKVYSDIVAKRRGAGKNKFDLFVPPSAADFELLLYKFLGKGELGEEQRRFFDEALLKPYINGVNLMDGARQSIKRSYKALTRAFPNVQKKLERLSPDKDFTYDQAIRVAMWNDGGVKIPGLTERDNRKLVDMVNSDPELLAFKEGLKAMSRQDKGWTEPSDYWDTDTIVSDLFNITQASGRKQFLSEFVENVDNIFGKWENGKLVGPNMNKIQAVYGTNVREALEDSLYRMINGKNRSYGQDKETSAWSNWVNGSTGVIMFLNTRSAVLQLISTANFLNLRDNNPLAAAAAFANQKQYWKDFATIWNSDKMKERRGGLREDVAAAEIANSAAGSKNKAAAVMSYLLKVGYTPTQMADSFAIASGGAPFYRNRVKTHIKEGMELAEAEALAWEEFSKVADETQQSGDPKDISKQQSSGAGRLLLTFQNTAMQQSRLVKKSFLDLKNGRGDAKTHIAKISYYLLIQNTIFSVLQQGLFALMFDSDEEEEEKIKKQQEKAVDLANNVLDSILRGTGFAGGVVSVLKNVTLKYLEEKEKDYQADYAKVILEGANISPPIGSKLRKAYTALKQTQYDKDLIKERGWSIMQDGRVHLGPNYQIAGKASEVLLNVPLDRAFTKIENVSQALNNEHKAWQRVSVGLGFNPYSVGIGDTPGDKKIVEEAKAKRKEEGIIKAQATRERKKEALKDSIADLSRSERNEYLRGERKKKREKALAKRKKRRMGGD